MLHPLRSSLVIALLATGLLTAARAAAPPADTLLPASTKAFVSAPKFPETNKLFTATRLGQMLEDPALEPFFKDLRRQLRQKWAKNQAEVGTTWDDFEPVASGEVALALVHPPKGNPGMVFIADVTGNQAAAESLLAKVAQDMASRKARKLNARAGDIAVQGYEFPPTEQGQKPEFAYYVLHRDLLLASDEIPLLDLIIRRLAAPARQDTLAGTPGYVGVIERAAKGSGNKNPQLRWFVDPIGVIAAIEADDAAAAPAAPARPGQPARPAAKKKSNAETYRALGFGAVQGIGGFVYMPGDQYDFLSYSAIHAPRPWEKSMNMLALPNGTNLDAEDWVPADVAVHIAFNVDVKQAEANFEPLFDQLFGEGESGVWTDVKESLRDDPNGPGIDLVKDLVDHLGQRATFIVDHQLPISPTCERSCLGIATTNPAALAEAIKKSMSTDPNVKHRVFQGFDIWEMTEEAIAAPEVELENPGVKTPRPGAKADVAHAEEEAGRLLPRSAVTVARGHLFVASHVDFLEKILAQQAADSLATAKDYQQVNAEMQNLKAGQNSLRSFIRRDKAVHPTYELIRRNQLPEAQTMLAQFINRVMAGDDDKKETRANEIDGSKLPPFEQIERYLGLGGLFLTSEDTGWFAIGFTPKDASAQISARPANRAK